MAVIAKCSARALLAGVKAAVSGTNPEPSCRHDQVRWFQRYHLGGSRRDGSGWARWPGWALGQSAWRPACGRITAQFTNDMDRDHRNMPLLLVMLKVPCTAANQPRYPAPGITPASSAAPALRQPTQRSSRNSGM